MSNPISITIELPDDVIALIIERAASRVAAQLGSDDRPGRSASRQLTVHEAADYLGCSTALIYKMRSDGRLTNHRQGGAGRAWCDREELDLYKAGERHPAAVIASRRTRLRPARNG